MHGVLSVSLSASFFNHTLRPLTTQGLKKQLYAAAVTRAQFFYVYIFGLFYRHRKTLWGPQAQ